MMDTVRDHLARLGGPWGDAWRWYGKLDPEQQRSALLLLVLGAGGFAVWIMYQAHGDRVVVVLPAMVARYSLILLALPLVLIGRTAGAGWSVPAVLRRDWTAEPDPDRPRITARRVEPMKLPNEPLPANEWHLFDRDWKGLSAIGVISRPRGGKDETVCGPALYHELMRGDADLIIVDPKLEQTRAAVEGDYLPGPEEADVYIYGTSPQLDPRWTDTFDLFALERSLTTARILTEEKSRDDHWQHKAADLIVAVARALEEYGERVTINDVREVVIDREALKELRKENRMVDNVADEDREWGYIRSSAVRALEPLASERARAMFDAEKIRMPDYTSDKRQIALLAPDPGAGEEEAKLTAAMLEVLVQLGRTSGPDRVQKFLVNEAGSFCSLARLPQYMEMGRGEGVYMMYVLQSYSQLVRRLEAAGARSLWTGSSAQIVGHGAEPELAQEMGRYTEPVRMTHRQPRQYRQDPGAERREEERRPALLEHHITGLRTGQWVMRLSPEIYRFDVPKNYTQTEYLKRLARRNKRSE